MLNELEKNGLSINILNEISYKSSVGKNLKNSLRKFSKEELFDEVRTMIRYYTEIETLDEVDLDYRIKSLDSCLRKYDKYYPEMQVEKVFNDILGFRMLVDDYNTLINSNTPEGVRMVCGRILNEHDFEEVLKHVLSSSKEI